MNSFFVLACLASLAFSNAKSKDYCKLNCGEKPNIACNFTGGFDKTCSDVLELYTFSHHNVHDYRFSLVDSHNQFRDSVQDDLNRPASKMLTVKWDFELAKIAEIFARKCLNALNPSKPCFGLDRFPYPGRNMYVHKAREGDEITVHEVMENGLINWYNSYEKTKDINALLDSYPESSNSLEHPSAPFARMLVDRNCALGCAVGVFSVKKGEYGEQEDVTYYVFVCIYSFDGEPGKAVYETASEAGTKCTKRHTKYPNLCHPTDTEKIIKNLSKPQ